MMTQRMKPRLAMLLLMNAAIVACGGSGTTSASAPSPIASPPPTMLDSVSLAATLDSQPFGDPQSTETLFIVEHGQRLFASNGQWTVPQSQQTGGQPTQLLLSFTRPEADRNPTACAVFRGPPSR